MPDPKLLRRWEEAAERLLWRCRWDALYEPGERGGRWFTGATLNAAENCLDRHLPTLAEKVAFHWEGEPGDQRTLTYGDLHAEVCAFADALRGIGVGRGDRVALYMGLIPETIVAMLACARIGAVHAVLASALPADALADRLADLDAKVLVTQDGAWRHGVILPLKARADEAIPAAAGVDQTIVVRRTGTHVTWYEGDRWYDELVARPRPGTLAATDPPIAVGAEQPLLVAYIANRRGSPTGIVHGTGGFLTYATAIHDGISTGPDDISWLPSEVAWIGCQTHAVYGPLACGATTVLFEGMLDTPTHRRGWEVIERYGVTTFATTPSVFRNLRRWTDSRPRARQLRSLRTIITAGEPLEPELRDWLCGEVARPSTVVADAWGQTELGGIVLLSEAPAGRDPIPAPGLDVVDEDGRSVPVGAVGELVLGESWPGTFLAIQNDDAAEDRYWDRYPGVYATGDRAVRNPDGSVAFLGRIDPVVSVSGQLVSLTEVREALLEHPFVQTAEIVDCVDRQAGQTLAAFVVLADPLSAGEDLARALRDHVRERLGGLAQPRTIGFVETFAPDPPPDVLRQALRMLCAAAEADTVIVTAEQLQHAASGATAGAAVSAAGASA